MTLSDPKILSRLSKNGIPKEEFEKSLGLESELSLELLRAQGMNIILHNDLYLFETLLKSVDDTLF